MGGSLSLRYATGGVMAHAQTSAELADGRRITFGESGPEVGFFPLKRGKDGRLGVNAEGGGGGNVHRTTNVNVTVRATDPNAFRSSHSQIVSDAKRKARL